MILLQGLVFTSFLFVIACVVSFTVGIPVFIWIMMQKKLRQTVTSQGRSLSFFNKTSYIVYYAFIGTAVATLASGAFYIMLIVIGKLIRYMQ